MAECKSPKKLASSVEEKEAPPPGPLQMLSHQGQPGSATLPPVTETPLFSLGRVRQLSMAGPAAGTMQGSSVNSVQVSASSAGPEAPGRQAPVCGQVGSQNGSQMKRMAGAGALSFFHSRAKVPRSSGLSRGTGTSNST